MRQPVPLSLFSSALLVSSVALIGCPSIPDDRFTCARGEACPPGLFCSAEGRCVRTPQDGGGLDLAIDAPGLDARTDAPAPDASESDARLIDAASDAASASCTPGSTVDCTTPCGSTGTAPCPLGFPSACTPPPEACDGEDDDCDTMIDEDLASRPCATGCGAGTEHCASGTWTGCTATTPMPETCNGVNDDCDGAIDEDLTRACSTRCGTGTERCAAGAWAGCSAPPVLPEACNGIDDDCNGRVDDPLQVTRYDRIAVGELTAYATGCTSYLTSSRISCWAAAERWCQARNPCSPRIGGYGPVQAGSATSGTIVCLGAAAFARVTVARSALDLEIAATSTTDASSRAIQSAVDRYCRLRAGAYSGGVGPIEADASTAEVLCVRAPYNAAIDTTLTEISAAGGPVCTIPLLDSLECVAAADSFCNARLYEGGVLVEVNVAGGASVRCFRDPP